MSFYTFDELTRQDGKELKSMIETFLKSRYGIDDLEDRQRETDAVYDHVLGCLAERAEPGSAYIEYDADMLRELVLEGIADVFDGVLAWEMDRDGMWRLSP